MKKNPFLLFFLALAFNATAQNTDPLSYHTARQLSDSSYSFKKANGDSTIFLFEGVGGMPDLSSRNYPNDSIAVTDGHLSQWDYYRTGNVVKVVTDLPEPNYNFYFIVNTSDSMNVKFEMVNNIGVFNANVNWGDGASDSYSSSDTTVQHNYSSVADYKITLTFTGANNLTKFRLLYGMIEATANVTSIHNIDKLTQLDGLEIYKSKMTNIDTLHYPATLRYLELYHNSLTSFNPTTLPPIIKVIDFNRAENLTSFNIPVPPSTLRSVQLDHCNLSVSQVNNLLTFLDSNTNWSGLYIYLEEQQTPAPPSGAGITAKNSLIAKGDTVTTD